MMVLAWSQWIFVVVNTISIPFYLLLMIVCFKEWKRNCGQRTFYLLMISQGIMDIFVMTNYFLFGILRSSDLFNDFYWTYQDRYIAAWCFNQTYVLAFPRCFGLLLISFQRYISICKNGSHIEELFNISHRRMLPILHWILPLTYSIPLLYFSNGAVTFIAPDNLEINVEKQIITLATSMGAVFVSSTFVLCILCYGAMLRFLLRNRYSVIIAVKRERRLYVRMLGFFTAFLLLLIFNIMQFLFSLQTNGGPIFTMRTVYPVISCFFSYISSWMMLILNEDIRRKILLLFGYRLAKNKVSTSLSMTLKTNPSTSALKKS